MSLDSPSAFSRELAVMHDAAARAAAAVMRVYATDFAVAFKDLAPNAARNAIGDDPVTAADKEANAIIVEALAAAFPRDAIVAEESAIPAGFERARRCWFVDPLDGTRELIARNGEFCVMIGLAIDGRARLGVLAVPALAAPGCDRLGFVLSGEVGLGARLVDGAGLVSALSVSDCDDPARATIVVSRSRRSKLLDPVFAALGHPSELPCGSVGVKIARMLTGARADGYVHLTRTGDSVGARWDFCAPEAILVAAGGRFTDQRGAAIDYAQQDVRNRSGLVASNTRLHARLLAAVAPVIEGFAPA